MVVGGFKRRRKAAKKGTARWAGLNRGTPRSLIFSYIRGRNTLSSESITSATHARVVFWVWEGRALIVMSAREPTGSHQQSTTLSGRRARHSHVLPNTPRVFSQNLRRQKVRQLFCLIVFSGAKLVKLTKY